MAEKPESAKKPVKVGLIIVVCVLAVGLIVAIIGGYNSNWEWTGIGKGEGKTTTTWITPGTTTATPETSVATETQPAKTLWDWLGLLAVLAIPVVVGIGAAWYTAQQGKVSDRENTDNQREAALQKYIDNMSQLLLDKDHPLRESAPEDEVRKIARVRTLTIFPRLDEWRNRSALQFLYESALIEKGKPIIDLSGANLSSADLNHTALNEANLNEAILNYADLSGANLSGADLNHTALFFANLVKANLSGTSLVGTSPVGANLSGANLSGANLSDAALFYANLNKANLSGANLSGADLSFANLSGADLSKAKITEEQLAKAKSLKGATMPDGSIHP